MSALDEQTIPQYEGAVTGPEIDQALLDMANHTSERYANGKAGGVPVSPGEVGYQDNSEYFKNQADDSAAAAAASAASAANSAQRAESAVPVGTESAILWTTDQSTELTAADKAVARKNIMAGGSNPNLLDNPWFTVNQRGLTTYSSRGYTADRWIELSSNTTVTVNSSGLTFTSDASMGLHQWFDDTFLVGKTVTLSILYQDGKMSTKSFVWPSSGSGSYNDGLYLNVYYGTVYQSHHGIAFIHNTASVAIRAVKLELGSVSTLANDTPPNYAEELAKCQRYFLRIQTQSNTGYQMIGIGFITNATMATIPINLPTQMRRITSVTSSGTFKIYRPTDNYSFAISNIALGSQINSTAILAFTTSGATMGEMVFVQSISDVNAYIDLSADL